ncbi:MAG: hypothetical protein GC134_03020 [Proteobacteria bacterium]|nr:hypothetical protein [Pseudomonadota bacterium]
MWELIKYVIGIALTIMIISFLLKTVVVFVPLVEPAYALEAPAASPAVTESLFGDRTPIDAAEEARLNAMAGEVEENAVLEDVPADAAAPLSSGTSAVSATTSPATDVLPQIAEETLSRPVKTAEEVARTGILTTQNGGMSADLWSGMDMDRASNMLGRVRKTGLKSLAARRLLQRALMTEATPPAGAGQNKWLAERVATLHALGYAEAGYEMLRGFREDELMGFGLGRVWVESQLMAGNAQRACTYVRQFILNSDDVFWRLALMTCQAVEGDKEALRLSMDVATTAERGADPLLFQLLEMVRNGGDAPRFAPEDRLGPLHAAIYKAYPQAMTPDVISRLPDLILRQLMGNEQTSVSMRLQSAEKVVNDNGSGQDVERLIGLYDSVQFNARLLESPLKFVQDQPDGSIARALLWQAAGAAKLPSGKALVLKVLWESAERDGLSDLPGSLSPYRRGIEPEANLAWFSPYVVRTSLRSGNLPVAKAWWQTLSSNRSLSRDLAMERTDLAIAFAVLDNQMAAETLNQWWSAQSLDNAQSRQRTVRILALLEAMDMPVPADNWRQLHNRFNDAYVDLGKGPGPIWLRLVGSSIEAGHVGESVFMLIEPMMYTQPSMLSPQGVANIVAGLRYVNLKDDATGIALESLLHSDKPAY